MAGGKKGTIRRKAQSSQQTGTAARTAELPAHFKIEAEPVADAKAIVICGNARFTVLTSRMIRIEYDAGKKFEDRPSMPFWFRKQPVPSFRKRSDESGCEIITDHLQLTFRNTPEGFTKDTLRIALLKSEQVWHYDDEDKGNLGGTVRTLDGINGNIPLPNGLMSRSGWSVIDDSKTLVFNRDSWLEIRGNEAHLEKTKDLYFFGYGIEYQECLKDFCKVTGPVPLVPRWILGNWWSRYWNYSDRELTKLITDFKEHQIPLSICIIDMDWHIVKNPYTNGWTGYTWDRNYFPDPDKFLKWLHAQGLRTALNLHPADGIHPHENVYKEFAEYMGIDPELKKPVTFDIVDPKFTKGYFELLHHPLEKQGIDFWWMDWQQGVKTKLEGLDPLWWLNHLHYRDLGRDGKRRSFVFSRWGDWGNHRYPIGFSGDTHVTWSTLAYQPYFTATASNCGYSFWSHDIGGHFRGEEDPELFTRWIQFGTFSPILRLHSTKHPYIDRRPWALDNEHFTVIKSFMQLRHSLIPYIYTMNRKTSTECLPLIRPMYWEHPEQEEAYCCGNQYYFGTELIAAPFTTPMDPSVRLSRQCVWLPEGDWYNYFTGEYFKGGRFISLYGGIREMPLFAKAGAIVPLSKRAAWGNIANPDSLEINLFAGGDGAFELYEDDGETMEFKKGKCCTTSIRQSWGQKKLVCTIDPAKGDTKVIPSQREWSFVIYGTRNPDSVSCIVNGKRIAVPIAYDEDSGRLYVSGIRAPSGAQVQLTVETKAVALIFRPNRFKEKLRLMLMKFKLDTDRKSRVVGMLENSTNYAETLTDCSGYLTKGQLKALCEMLFGAGYELVTTQGPGYLVVWNPDKCPQAKYILESEWGSVRIKGEVPAFQRISFNRKSHEDWPALWPREDLTASFRIGPYCEFLTKKGISV